MRSGSNGRGGIERMDIVNAPLIELLRASGMEEKSPDAMQPGTRVYKCQSEPDDTHCDGASGTLVFLSVPVEGHRMAFVKWDDGPDIPVLIAANRIQQARRERT